MGCGGSTVGQKGAEMTKSEKSLKATILIQQWYRRYLARLEARKRYTWSIFQSLEYAGEQDQLRLYNFFNDMMIHLQTSGDSGNSQTQTGDVWSQTLSPPNGTLNTVYDSLEEEDEELLKLTDPKNLKVPQGSRGPQLKFPITTNQLSSLVDAFKKKQLLHAKYVLELLHEARKVLKRMPNIRQASTSISKQITICGDLHGKFDDLYTIFYKNGLPSQENPYIFNGDFVDRGPHSVEIAILLFACLVINPNEVYINRGNHEDHVMNLRYGFIKEVMAKYKDHAAKVVRLFEDVFSWLPLATVIDNKVLVTHGGISDRTDLEHLNALDRHKYLSVLRPPLSEESDDLDLTEWRQILDTLWSDPKPQAGCSANTFRGGGSYFGPDVTHRVLQKHKLSLLIRSHECKPEGFEFAHDDKVLTVFSASNYYEIGSNKGAYIKMGPDSVPRIVQYMVAKGSRGRKLTIKQRIGYVEASALRSLHERIYASKTLLLEEFEKYDPANMGLIKIGEWCQVMSDILKMDLPWRSLRPRLVKMGNVSNLVEYNSTFEEFKLENKLKTEDASLVTEALYRNKESLETIFRAIDKDNSGLISMEEFEEACSILSKHTHNALSKEDVLAMARNIDMNKDGSIDFNEFLEAFRLVDQFGRELHERERRRMSSEDDPDGGLPDLDLIKSPPPS